MDKPIKFSLHAEQRRKQRGFAQRLIIEVVKRPDYFKRLADGRKIAVRTMSSRTITVVYLEEESIIRIITVF